MKKRIFLVILFLLFHSCRLDTRRFPIEPEQNLVAGEYFLSVKIVCKWEGNLYFFRGDVEVINYETQKVYPEIVFTSDGWATFNKPFNEREIIYLRYIDDYGVFRTSKEFSVKSSGKCFVISPSFFRGNLPEEGYHFYYNCLLT